MSHRMKRAVLIVVLQVVLVGSAIVQGAPAQIPVLDLAVIGFVGAALIAFETAPARWRRRVQTWSWISVWVGTLAVFVLGVFRSAPVYLWDCFFAVEVWLIAAAILLTGKHDADIGFRTRWRILGLVWAFGGDFIWLGSSYLQNQQGVFLAGLLIGLALLFVCKRWFQLSWVGVQVVNTLILLFIGLPLVDLVFCPADHLSPVPDPAQRPYAYEVATRNRALFVRWWTSYYEQVVNLYNAVMIQEPAGDRKHQLRPGSEGTLFRSRIAVNSRGFRGREISGEKGDAYRIVALGESTTFGLTLNAGDRPWPELLEQLIRDRLKSRRLVEVINAGVLSIDLPENISRLPREILPLKPDLIISYHGYNGFPLLADAVPSVQPSKRPAPVYEQRALKLLADCEYKIKLLRYKSGPALSLLLHPPGSANPLETDYARCYRRLIEIARTNGVRLVLANYSMAVNGQSDPRVVEFYREVFPSIYWQIKANQAHSEIVRELARECPDITMVDTHPGLDGVHDRFIDVMHFAPDGEQQMAETLFKGLKKILEQDLLPRESAGGQ